MPKWSTPVSESYLLCEYFCGRGATLVMDDGVVTCVADAEQEYADWRAESRPLTRRDIVWDAGHGKWVLR